MGYTDTIKEFFSKPREWHAFGAGLIFSYLGLYHQPLLHYAGVNIMTPLAFGIGLMIIGVSVKAIRDFCNNILLPEKTNIPEDIRNEWIYYWFGIFFIYATSPGSPLVVLLPEL